MGNDASWDESDKRGLLASNSSYSSDRSRDGNVSSDLRLVLSPTLAKPPLPLGILSLSQPTTNWWKEIAEFSPYTALYNASGQPSMSVPLHWTADGLPVGVLFSSAFGEDATLLRLVAQLDNAQPWSNRRPLV